MTKISITRHDQHDGLLLESDDGRMWGLGPDPFALWNAEYDEEFAAAQLSALKAHLESKGETVEIDATIPAKHGAKSAQ